jgi:NAD-dependent deacetylase
MKKLVILTGAGISQESGIPTYRDTDGIWSEYDPDIYASIHGWNTQQDNLNRFYNERRAELEHVKPNAAHKFIADLEKDFDVTVITQNVDDLHERAGSTKIIHLHGELTKIRKEVDIFYKKLGDDSTWRDIGYGELDLVKDPDWRPAIVFFGENVPKMKEAELACKEADFFITIGTSLSVYPAATLIENVSVNTFKILIDPRADEINTDHIKIYKILKKATEAIDDIKDFLYDDCEDENISFGK